MKSIIALALKDLLLLWRDKMGLFWVLAFPLLMALFFGAIFSQGGSGGSNLKVAAINADSSELVDNFFKILEKSSDLTFRRMTIDSAKALVEKGKLTAYISAKRNIDNNDNYFPTDLPTIKIGIDPARKSSAGFLQGMTTKAYFQLMQNQMSNPLNVRDKINDNLAIIENDNTIPESQKQILKSFFGSLSNILTDSTLMSSSADSSAMSPFGSPDIKMVSVTRNVDMPRKSFEITFPQALLWGLLGCAMTFAISIVVERTRGTYLRLRIAPISRAQILAGKGLACFIACVLVCVILLIIAILIFGIRVVNPIGLLLAVLASAICFVGIMMMISVIGKTEQAVGGAGWPILLVSSMVGGGMVPLIAMPSWMLKLSNFSPVKWGIYALEGAIWRGFTISEMMMPLTVLVGIGLVTFLIGVTVLTRTDS